MREGRESMNRRERFIRQVKRAAARNFETYGRVAAMFVGQRKKDLVIMPLNGMQKDRAGVAVQLMRRACKLAAMVSECWMTMRDTGAQLVPPSECADRKEIVLVTI